MSAESLSVRSCECECAYTAKCVNSDPLGRDTGERGVGVGEPIHLLPRVGLAGDVHVLAAVVAPDCLLVEHPWRHHGAARGRARRLLAHRVALQRVSLHWLAALSAAIVLATEGARRYLRLQRLALVVLQHLVTSLEWDLFFCS